jgi:glutathione S-transferase
MPEAPAGGKPGVLMIYGDMFSSDTRTLIAVCRHANVNHELVDIDTLKMPHNNTPDSEWAKFVKINPTK